jgi:putative hemolysin
MSLRMLVRLAFVFTVGAVAAGCEKSSSTSAAPATPTSARGEPAVTAASAPASQPAAIANPASSNCTAKGGSLRIVDAPAGQSGVCDFSDGSHCEEWRLMRGQCAPGKCRSEDGICE